VGAASVAVHGPKNGVPPIRSDHKLRLLGRAIQVPDGHAYRYLTATLDLAIEPEHDNLLVSDEHGELITATRLARPRR